MNQIVVNPLNAIDHNSEISLNEVDDLFTQHAKAKADLVEFLDLMTTRFKSSLSYLQVAYKKNPRGNLFDLESGIKAIDSDYWDKALKNADVLPSMSYDRRNEWHENIRELKTPEFKRDSVVSTISQARNMRPVYLAERINAAFKMLSPNHLTNSKWGFSDRMIINNALDRFGYSNYHVTGKLDDLRTIIGTILNRNTLEEAVTTSATIVTSLLNQTGKWTTIDNGAMRIKLFKKGTIHMEIHPDVSCRLNEIPSEAFKPRKNPAFKDLPFNHSISVEASKILSNSNVRRSRESTDYTFSTSSTYYSKQAIAEAGDILASIGGQEISSRSGIFQFDYDPTNAIHYVIRTGTIPNWKDHQYYPTQEQLAVDAAIELDVHDNDICLEPSAGQGNLAKFLNKQTTCVEVSGLNCEILKSKGYKDTIEADFISWASKNTGKLTFNKILMNPPFSKSQASNHLLAASNLLASDGKLVAILPSSLKDKEIIAGFDHSWSETYKDQFDNTSVSVVILTLVREC